jgi:hypothetical protein
LGRRWLILRRLISHDRVRKFGRFLIRSWSGG